MGLTPHNIMTQYRSNVTRAICRIVPAVLLCMNAMAQNSNTGPAPGTHVTARLDARQMVIGDQVRLFLEATDNPAAYGLTWPVVPDTFNHLEVVERGKIDTIKQADGVMYKQRIILTGFDSGMYKVPSFPFVYNAKQGGNIYVAGSDSFELMVQTVAVDTTQGFKGIKGIIYVKSSWKDYIGLIIGAVIFICLMVFVILYFIKNRKIKMAKRGPVESLQDYALRLLATLDAKQLWQKKQVKEYYVELTDILRNYIELRFETKALELTTEELLEKARVLKELQPYYELLSQILQTADLAKFAKFQPVQEEHIDIMDKAKTFINSSRPVVIAEPTTENTNNTTK